MNPDKAQRTISHWVPAGTSESDAIRILTSHQFACKRENETNIACLRAATNHFTWVPWNQWYFELTLKDGNVVTNTKPTITSGIPGGGRM